MAASRIAFIGLGVMGFPLAGHLAKAGHRVTVYNRTASKAKQWLAHYPGQAQNTPALAAQDADFVISCVGNDNDLREVVLGPHGTFAKMQPKSILIDHTTTSAQVARELAAIGAKNNIGFIDAPVSGGQPGAEKGTLTVMCGGDKKHFDQAEKVIDTYARACQLMGEVGSGQLTKMVNQICITGLIQSLAEGLHFAEKAGLNPHQVIEVISKGAAQSWQMENRYKTMLAGEYNHGFAVDWMRKDLAICLEEARRIDVSLPVAALIDQFYAEVQTMGGQRWDTSSLLERLKKLSP